MRVFVTGAAVPLREGGADPPALAYPAAELRVEPGQPAVAAWPVRSGRRLRREEVADLAAEVGVSGGQLARVQQGELHRHHASQCVSSEPGMRLAFLKSVPIE